MEKMGIYVADAGTDGPFSSQKPHVHPSRSSRALLTTIFHLHTHYYRLSAQAEERVFILRNVSVTRLLRLVLAEKLTELYVEGGGAVPQATFGTGEISSGHVKPLQIMDN